MTEPLGHGEPHLGLLECNSYAVATQAFQWSDLWNLFDGDRERLNIAVECLDRHRDRGTAVRLVVAGASPRELDFDELTAWSSRFAGFMQERGVARGDRVGVMISPSLEFYAALFGAIKLGAVAVPLFTLFGPDALRARLEDCSARMLVAEASGPDAGGVPDNCEVVVADRRLMDEVRRYPDRFQASTGADDVAVLQYTSGTSRQLPEAVRHTHRAIVTLMLAARFGLGLQRGDRYMCPSSPAWGHGLWHGTIAPWALGIAAGAYSGRFHVEELVRGMRRFEISNLAAAGTVYRMLQRHHTPATPLPPLQKASYTGEALDTASLGILVQRLGTPICGMYGTTETGVILANFPGFADYEVRPGALGHPLPGSQVAVIDADERRTPIDVVGEIAVKRRGRWFRSKDLGRLDADGYFWYLGRADDVIISAGWTISPIEVEDVLICHMDVDEVVIVGVPDDLRGQVLKAFVVTSRTDSALIEELQRLVRSRLGPHEYPRQVELVTSLPRTPNGKINRRALRAQQPAVAASPAPGA